jgi:NADH dehydrogenase
MAGLVTLFGGGGFLGRYVAQELLRQGARVRIAERNPRKAWFLKPLGGLGQTQFIAVDIAKPELVERALAGADAAINLVGLLKGDFQTAHVTGARNIAEAAKRAGVSSLVQVSAIGADAASPSAYGRTKGEGEQAVRNAFAGASIVRPSILFGPEDQFVNRFARMIQLLPVIPVIRPTVRFQPAHVVDVARAIAAAALDPGTHAGKVYELGGPDILSMMDLNRMIAGLIGRDPSLVAVPDAVAQAMARFGGWAPGAPMTWDQWLMLQQDNVVGQGAKGFAAFGISPTPLSAVAPDWLVQYRRHGRFGSVSKAA